MFNVSVLTRDEFQYAFFDLQLQTGFNPLVFWCVLSFSSSVSLAVPYIFSLGRLNWLLPAIGLLSFPFPAKQKIKENETLDELFADIDQNGDLEIDFKEFISLIAMVTSACQELFVPNYRGS